MAIRNYFFLPPSLPGCLLAFLSVNHCLFFCLCPPLREMMIHAASCSTKDDLQYDEMSEVRAQTPAPSTFLSPRLRSVTCDVSFFASLRVKRSSLNISPTPSSSCSCWSFSLWRTARGKTASTPDASAFSRYFDPPAGAFDRGRVPNFDTFIALPLMF